MNMGEPTEQMEYIMENALRAYQETEMCAELERQREQAEQELQQRFAEEDFSFNMKRVDIFNIRLEREEAFLYCQAFKDCISLLKQLEIIR